jgi:hypothetical protein
MSAVTDSKLVAFDYNGDDTVDLGFLRTFSDGMVLTGELGVWLLGPGTSLPIAQAVVNGPFPYATGDSLVDNDGFVPGFYPYEPPVSADDFPLPSPFFAPDFNGDGKTDQVFGSDAESLSGPAVKLSTWFMDGTGVIGQQAIKAPDGVTDALVTGNFLNPLTLLIGGQGPLADFNGDGTTDILFLNTAGTGLALWLIENGTAVTQALLSETIGAGWALINTNDFDGNGTTDLLFEDEAGAIGVWTMNGTQVTAQAQVGVADPGWVVVDTNDFDGNGTADIAFFNVGTGEVGIWTMNGTQATSQAVVGTVTGTWQLIDHNDFNGDGKADLLFKEEGGEAGDRYAMWLLDGTNTPISQSVVKTTTGADAIATAGWEYFSSGDTDGDGKANLGFVNVSNPSSGGAAIWQMDGNIATQQQVIGAVDLASGWNPAYYQPLPSMTV